MSLRRSAVRSETFASACPLPATPDWLRTLAPGTAMTREKMKKASKTRRRIANLLLLAGVLALGVWTWSNFHRAVFQDWENWVFDRKAHGESVDAGQYLAEKKDHIVHAVQTCLRSRPAPVPYH